VITGPCSLHDEDAAIDYGQRLAALNEQLSDRLLIVMRAYVEKPRTHIGWKGLAYDPDRTGSGDMALGLERSRRLMLRLIDLGLPLATEALNPLAMLYLDDLVSWTAIGARTTESQTHREMVSHLPMPVGLKNGTDGSIAIAVNAMISARHSHHTLGVDGHGQIAMLDTPGNPDTHLVLRGGRGITNYDADSIAVAQQALQAADCNARVLVDCSHDNACKQHERQIDIALDVAEQRQAGNDGILGVMLESFIEAGNQKMDGELVYGKSITDPCLSWTQTEALLQALHQRLG
jgi:3-deoxy-7-phosphoheptulonate synthase